MIVRHHFCLSVAVGLLSLLAMLSLVLGVGVLAEAKTLNVANNGVDSATCGDKDHPCRSISKAIENASTGDKIIVGPGRYGDLAGDGFHNPPDPGDEKAEVGSGCICMIRVNQRLTIESRDGAGATVLDAGGADVHVVQIETSGTVFGKKNKGFTLTHGITGLYINNGTNGVRVTGNLATANSSAGFYFFFISNDSSGHQLTGNAAIATNFGFVFGGRRHQLRGNLASANSRDGFNFGGSGHALVGNVASANGFTGFDIFDTGHVLTGNLASANGQDGFAFIGSGHLLSGNSALGNGRFGILVETGASATITKNNIFGNNSKLTTIGGIPFSNCGVYNSSGKSINATNNFWGISTGPVRMYNSPTDPADNICDDFNFPGSSTNANPFSTKEIKVQSSNVLFSGEPTQLMPTASGGKTLFVANNGVDSVTCGDKNNPCRSISKAIANASPDDKIVVGPGRYGDLNGDGNLDDPGDENAEVGFGCFCMIKVNKRLTIESRDGAAATVLDAGGINVNVVRIEASEVVFGKKNKGFTLTHAGRHGLFIADGTSGVKVGGNLATRNGARGFNFSGSGHVLTGNLASANVNSGFDFSGSGHVLTGNTASANGGTGFNFGGSGHLLSGNLAAANSYSGFDVFGSGHVLTGNLANANGEKGFAFSGSGHVLTGNGALGNGLFGILVETGASATITKNNIFGNNSMPASPPTFSGETNCGLLNRSGGVINATNNFWGVANGPGTLATPKPEPADNVCDDPGAPGSSTTFAPFATKEFQVKGVTFLEEPGLVVPADPMEKETLPVPLLRAMQTKDGLLFSALGDANALRLEVTDLSGKKIYDSGFVRGQTLSWTGVNTQNRPVANGVYLYRLTARDREGREVQSELRKLIILK